MKKILLFGAGKSATCLIDYLIKETAINKWQLVVADGNLTLTRSKLGQATHAQAIAIDVENEPARKALVKDADIVISLLPPGLHFLIAKDCIEFSKNLLTASYVDDKIKTLGPEIKDKGLLFLCEMGLDPGIDHMSAMELIHRIKEKGGNISSFKSHTGGLIALESDNNPWHYKIRWNPRNVVMAGAAGAVYKENDKIKNKDYTELFNKCREVMIPGIGQLAWYPNRDSLAYIPVYQLEEATTFIRTTLRYPVFCTSWKSVVAAGLTNDKKIINTDNLDYKKWAAPIIPFISDQNKTQLAFLGLFDELPVPASAKTNADILQYLLETKLPMLPHDKDMIVMLHELAYEIQNTKYEVRSELVVKGEDNVRTAMAKTVGLPLGIAAILMMQGKINITGLHIPILPEIYIPVLKELEQHGVQFTEAIS